MQYGTDRQVVIQMYVEFVGALEERFVFLTDRLRFKYMFNLLGLWEKCGRGLENSHRGRKKAALANPRLRQSRKAANM